MKYNHIKIILRVSGSTCKELRSCHSFLTTSENHEQTQTQKSMTLIGERMMQDKPLSSRLERQISEYRE